MSGGGHSPLPALAATELMASGAADEHVAMVRRTLGARSAALRRALVDEGVVVDGRRSGGGGGGEMEMDVPRGGYFAWLRLREPRDEAWWAELGGALERESVTVTPGRRCVFGVGDEHSSSSSSSSSWASRALESAAAARQSLRLSFAKVTERECAEGARRLARALQSVVVRR